MPARQYPFIDIAVHARVREHFARGDAAILFSRDFTRILWANNQGAAFFGAESIYDFIDAGPDQNDLSLRQLRAAASQLLAAGDRRQLSIRKFSGFRGLPLAVSVEMIRVRPDEEAVLFAAPHAGAPLSLEDRAARMIAGLDGPDTHMAVLDGDGGIVAQSPGFADLGMSDETRRQLVTAVARDHDWLIKRPVATRKGQLPAALGKIADDPALHLLFAVETILGTLDPEDAGPVAEEAPTLPIREDQPAGEDDIPADAALGSGEAEAEPFEGTVTVEDPASGGDREVADTDLRANTERPADTSSETAAESEPAFGDAFAAEQPGTNAQALIAPSEEESVTRDAVEETAEIVAAPVVAPAEQEVASEEVILEATGDDDVTAGQDAQNDGAEDIGEARLSGAEQPGFAFTPGGRAVRFVWKIDAEGRFSEISEEFATAVGPQSADVIGTTFADVAARYDLDPEHKINTLLQRRDTWSGKTIFWPIQGTSLKVPVDLAALPTYSRSREFDGFRGFGIVRLADAVDDENANGLRLGAGTTPTIDEGPVDVAPLEQHEHDAAIAPVAEDHASAIEPVGVQRTPEPVEAVATETGVGEPDALPLFADARETVETVATEAAPAEQPTVHADPFQGERPALRVVETTEQGHSDKIIELEKHRPASALTRGEQAAFREIARQLGEQVDRPAVESTPTAEGDETIEPTEGAYPTANGNVPEDVLPIPAEEAGTETADQVEANVAEATIEATAEAGVPPQVTDIGLSGEILDTLPIGMLVHRGDQLLHANPEFLRLAAYRDLDAFAREGGIEALFAQGEEATEQEPDGTMTLIRGDGQLRPVTARLHTIRWDGKSALMLALTPATATSAHQAKGDDVLSDDEQVDRLKTEIEELKSILETATDGVVVLGHDGDIRSMNRSASALFNYDEGEIRGKPFAALFAHESQKAVIDYLHGLAGHGVASVLNDGREVIGREANGGFIPLFMTIGRLSASNGFCAVIRDITQWKRTEEELRNAKRAAETANAHKTEFLARVSHEIRTPLNAIIGFSDMMASEHFGPVGHPRYIEYAGDIGRSGRHVLDIVNDLLDISKIEAGEMELDFGAVEINEAVSEAVSLVQPQANSQRVIIRTSLSATVPNVVADGRSIKQIALNILANAIRFTPSGGQIVVSTSYEANGSVILRVRDTGVGMTRSELEQAMKPFRQVTTGARKRGDGTGLGLPLTKAMAEANRAQFSITSAPNEGTLVEISFPSQRVLAK
ncbi:ATP-binding protein [Ensifer sp. MJa1]|uniref:ATP-binding protein n=1 Tax=Ensifer sp. MJa1 TaxID=2919888 RepID=UPI00300ABB77